MAELNEDALKQFIASLPDLDNERELSGLGYDETGYISGVRDAYRVLTGEQPHNRGKSLIEHAKEARNHAPDWYKNIGRDGFHCGVCGVDKSEGDVPWHSSPA